MAVHDEVFGLSICELEFDLAAELVELLFDHLVDVLSLVGDFAEQGQVSGLFVGLRSVKSLFGPHLRAALHADGDRFLRFFGLLVHPYFFGSAWQR